jgi:predicted outer membrane repeat protein
MTPRSIVGVRSRHPRQDLSGALLVVAVAVMAFPPGTVEARRERAAAVTTGSPRVSAPDCSATVRVTTVADTGAGSLRQALVDVCDGGTIDFDPTTFSTPRTVTLSSTLVVTKGLTISGPGAALLALDGNHAVRVINITVANAQVVIADVTIANGQSGGFFGGGVSNGTNLRLTGCVFAGNSSSGTGGGLYTSAPTVITDSTFSQNSAGNGGAIGISRTNVQISSTSFASNAAVSNDGGAIYMSGLSSLPATLTILDGAFSSNTAVRHGGALYASSYTTTTVTRSSFLTNTSNPALPSTQGAGGAINNAGALTVARCAFVGNTAGSASGSNNSGGAIVTTSATDITNSTFRNNSVRGAGGALHYKGSNSSGLILNTTVYGNTLMGPGSGGGISYDASSVTMRNSIVASNTTNCSGPGLAAASQTNQSNDSSCSPGFATVTLTGLALEWRTAYYYPLHGSVAIDAGTNAGCPAVDQRGRIRPRDEDGDATANCDIGAIEADPVRPVPTFTNDPLTPRSTPVRAIHVQELRQRINELRTLYALTAFTWTDSILLPTGTPVLATHVAQLRTALDDVYRAAGQTPPTYTTPTPTPGATTVAAIHVAEIRAAVLAIW